MTHELVVRSAAATDIVAAVAWYDTQRSGLGDAFLAELLRISDGPFRYQTVYGEVRRAIVRRFPYSVYFLADNTAVTVLAILHHRRSPGAWRRR